MKGKISVPTKQIDIEIDVQLKEISEFLKDITPQAIKELGGLFSDTVRGWRVKNEVGMFKKVKEQIADSGLSIKQIPLKVLVPIMENSSLEEDPLMKEKWVNMLANAATGQEEISPNYAAMLNELSPVEVKLLDQIFVEASRESDYEKRKLLQFDTGKVRQIFNISTENADLIIENLFRLNILQSPAGHGISVGEYKFALRTTKVFEFTTLGYEFVKACRWNTK